MLTEHIGQKIKHANSFQVGLIINVEHLNSPLTLKAAYLRELKRAIVECLPNWPYSDSC